MSTSTIIMEPLPHVTLLFLLFSSCVSFDEISSCHRIEHPCWGGSGAGYTTYSGPEGITLSKTVTTLEEMACLNCLAFKLTCFTSLWYYFFFYFIFSLLTHRWLQEGARYPDVEMTSIPKKMFPKISKKSRRPCKRKGGFG